MGGIDVVTRGTVLGVTCALLVATPMSPVRAQSVRATPAEPALPDIEGGAVVEGVPRPFSLLGEPPRTFAGADYRAGLAMLRASLPDLKIAVVSRDRIGNRTILRLRFSGRFTGAPLAGYTANGAVVQFEGVDILESDATGKIVKLASMTDYLPLLRAITTAMPGPFPVESIPSEPVYAAPRDDFIESFVVEPDGSVLMSLLFSGRIARLTTDGRTQVVARLPGYAAGMPGFICIARTEDGSLYATTQNRDAAGKVVSQLWRIPATGEPEPVVTFPEGAQPNGLTGDGRGGVIVGDNVRGLWRVDPARRTVARWSEDAHLTRRDYLGELPAANGVQRAGDMIYVTNSDRGLLLRIPIMPDGAAGRPEVVASGVPGDDFAVDDDGTAYVATHPHDSIIKVASDGHATVIATAREGLAGPTSAMIAVHDGVRYLYVANDGGIFVNRPAAERTPGIVRYRLDGRR